MVRHYPALNRPERPRCSVCIANYNGEALLPDCVASLLAQQGTIAFEILVHDDASTDASVAMIRERWPQVELLASEENVGFCVSNNRMVAHARGEHVLLLNNDAALLPDALAALLEAADAMRAPGILTLPQHDWDSDILVDRGCLLDPFYNPVPNLDPARDDVAMAIGACLFLPRALWDDLGGFPEWFGSIGEDLYLCCVARLRGAPMRVLATSGYRHRQGASFGGNRVDAGKLRTTVRRRSLSERNKTATLVVCTPTALVWPLLALHVLALAIEGVVLALVRFDRSTWTSIHGPALRHALGAPWTLAARRRAMQATRRIGLRDFLRCFVVFPRKLRLLWRHGIPTIR